MQNRDLWRLLEPDARKRVAAFTFVIVDLCFQCGIVAARLSRTLDEPYRLHTLRRYSAETLEDLLLETLMFVRQAAREDISVAKAMFAMIPSVATTIASLTLPQVRTVAVGNTRRLRVRWDSHPEFWGDLLVACRGRDETALATLRRQGKLLFCGEFVQRQG